MSTRRLTDYSEAKAAAAAIGRKIELGLWTSSLGFSCCPLGAIAIREQGTYQASSQAIVEARAILCGFTRVYCDGFIAGFDKRNGYLVDEAKTDYEMGQVDGLACRTAYDLERIKEQSNG